VTGTIVQLRRDHGTLLGEDGKCCAFRRYYVRDAWFHDLKEGATVAFEADKNLSATAVRPLRAS
jgi:hypothetical protein